MAVRICYELEKKYVTQSCAVMRYAANMLYDQLWDACNERSWISSTSKTGFIRLKRKEKEIQVGSFYGDWGIELQRYINRVSSSQVVQFLMSSFLVCRLVLSTMRCTGIVLIFFWLPLLVLTNVQKKISRFSNHFAMTFFSCQQSDPSVWTSWYELRSQVWLISSGTQPPDKSEAEEWRFSRKRGGVCWRARME